MNKSLKVLFVCMLAASTQSFSQSVQPDSVKKIAAADAEKFKISDENLKRFRNERSKHTSDIFKPTANTTTNVSLLNDSVYVKAYRQAAHQNTKDNTKVVKKRSTIATVGYVAGGLAIVALAFVGLNEM
ncbi:hypothetical protein [Pedobacter aquatilis]|uniref:hypothetical protein n=1 Tax=Pedobacter aquatilis TaxID=351343 RepID=UPI00292E6AA5|nr:hypothetical protein [Pedobacter aquatilis]